MGGAVSTGEDNDDLVDNLVEHDCIRSGRVEHVFRAVDRGHYFTEECRDSAYKDTAWRSENLHLSAPCIYSSVLENLDLKPGHSFLNIGSGTGYVSTMAGLIIESSGVNHGVELFQDVIDYAHERLANFFATSSAVDQFDFCPPQFVCGNGLLIAPGHQYDRVYCGARCPLSELHYLKQLLKLGGVLVVPVNDHLKRIERLGHDDWQVHDKLSVSFAGLIEPNVSGHKTELSMPPRVPASLQQLCRTLIRRLLRARLLAAQPPPPPGRAQTARRRRRPVGLGRRAEQARRIQRFVMPLLGAAVVEVDDDGEREDEEGEEEEEEDIEGEEEEEDVEGEEREDSDQSEEAYMELAGALPAEPDTTEPQQPQQQQGSPADSQQPQKQQQQGSPADSQKQQEQQQGSSAASQQQGEEEKEEEEEEPGEGSPLQEEPRASLKRSSEESGAGGDGEPAAGAGPSDTQKRGRRDKFDSGLGESPPPPLPPALPPRDHSEPENGVAASSDAEDDDDDDDGDGDGVGRGRRLLLLPPPSRWGGRTGRFGAEFATELSRFLAADSDDDEELEEAGQLEERERRARCPFERRRRGRPARRAAADSGRRLAEQLRALIAALPLPPPLRLYVNLDRPL